MTKFSSIAVLTAFFVCGIALGAHARDVEKIARQGLIPVEVSCEANPWHSLDVLPVSAVPDFKAEKAEPVKKEACTVIAMKECENGHVVVAAGSGETCAEAATEAAASADGTPCPKNLPPLYSV